MSHGKRASVCVSPKSPAQLHILAHGLRPRAVRRNSAKPAGWRCCPGSSAETPATSRPAVEVTCSRTSTVSKSSAQSLSKTLVFPSAAQQSDCSGSARLSSGVVGRGLAALRQGGLGDAGQCHLSAPCVRGAGPALRGAAGGSAVSLLAEGPRPPCRCHLTFP